MKTKIKYKTARHQGGKLVMHPGQKSMELAVALRNTETGKIEICKAVFNDVTAYRQTPDVSNIPEAEDITGCMEIINDSPWITEINEQLLLDGAKVLPPGVTHFIQYFPPDDFIEILAGSVHMFNENGEELEW